MPVENGNKTPLLFGLPLNWGTQLTITSVGAGFFWWAQEKWLEGRSFPAAKTTGERLWQTAPALASMALTIFCLTWVAALFIKAGMLADSPGRPTSIEGVSGPREGAALLKRLLVFMLFTAAIAALYGVSASFAYSHFPFAAGKITAAAGILALAALIAGTPLIIRGKGSQKEVIYPAAGVGRPEIRRYGPPRWWTESARWIPTVIFLGIFFAPFQTIRMEWRLIALVLVLLWPLGVNRLKIWIYQQSRKGNPAKALRLNRLCAWTPGYGVSFEGLILFDAGRYGEAREFLKPLAFDAAGHPRLTSLELYVYSIALINDDRAAEAEPLLEAAVQVKRPNQSIEMTLASCLLTQRKDAERACVLIEGAMSTPEVRMTGYGKASDYASRLAHYAWALASAGRRDDSLTQIQKALSACAGLKDSDKASVEYFIGEAWEAMGDVSNARSAFEASLNLRSEGVTAVSARKGLERIKLS
jgi:hypothetical protein